MRIKKPRQNLIVQCFGVLDEADILEHFLTYHLSIGIDAFVAIDLGSTDGTLDILSRHERAGYLHLVRAEGEWTAPMLKIARERYDPEWCLFGDVDEFWIFPDGNARAYLGSAPSGIIVFPRYNVLPLQDAESGSIAHFSKFDLVVHNPIQFFYHEPVNAFENLPTRREERDYATMLLWSFPPEILRVIAPKVVVRPELVQSLTPGFHNVISVPANSPRYEEQIGYIAHYPMRSIEQFRRKAAHVATIFDQVDGNPDRAYHWVRLSVLFKHKLIEQEFSRQLFSEDEIDRLLFEGVLRRDPTLKKLRSSMRASGQVESSFKALISRIAQGFGQRAAAR